MRLSVCVGLSVCYILGMLLDLVLMCWRCCWFECSFVCVVVCVSGSCVLRGLWCVWLGACVDENDIGC